MTVRPEALPLQAWLLIFLVAAAVLVRAATALAKAGDAIASGSRMGGFFVGALLVAGATSLPELATDVSAAIDGAPRLAVGDIAGSSMANMAILAVADLASRHRLLPAAGLAHARTATVAIALTALAVIGMLTPGHLAIGWIGGETVAIAVLYVVAMRWISRGTAPRPFLASRSRLAPRHRLRRAVITFSAAAAVILVTAPSLAVSAAGIASLTGIGTTFVGVTLVAATTSLPELVSSVAAVRLHAFDVAVGNLFGSNAFNMAMLLPIDIAYTRGPLLKAADTPGLVVAAVAGILLMAVALAALLRGEERRIGPLEPDSVVLAGLYVGCLFAVWVSSGSPV